MYNVEIFDDNEFDFVFDFLFDFVAFVFIFVFFAFKLSHSLLIFSLLGVSFLLVLFFAVCLFERTVHFQENSEIVQNLMVEL